MSTSPPQVHWIRRLVDHYEAPLIRYAARITGDLSRARDIVQDTFLRLCRETPEKVEPIAPQWLYRVCRNRALDIQRKDQRMVATDFSKLPRGAEAGLDDVRQPDPASQAAQSDESLKALRLLTELPERQQEVIRLKIEHGLSYKEIAEITGHSVSNVGYLLHTGLKTLRLQMAKPLASPKPATHANNNGRPT